MKFSDLSRLDQNLRSSKEYTFREMSIPVDGEDLLLEGVLCTPVKRSGYYYAVQHPKERILLHFTAGNIRSDLGALTQDQKHVSVPFVIGRDGVIYQLFSSGYWSGNIGQGIGNTDTGNAQDKATIAIEISNYGYLVEREGNLETIYSRPNGSGAADIYCSLNDREAYQKLTEPFRKEIYYSTFTDDQYNSIIILLRYLTKKYGIPRQFFPETLRYSATEEVLNFKGIVTHVNYRPSGKWDIGPAFDWTRVMEGVQSATYTPIPRAIPKDLIDTTDRENILGSEDAILQFLPKAKDAIHENEPYEEGHF